MNDKKLKAYIEEQETISKQTFKSKKIPDNIYQTTLDEIEEEKRLKREEMFNKTKDVHSTYKVNIPYFHKEYTIKEEEPEP